MNFNFSNIFNLLEAKQGNFDVRQNEKKSAMDSSNALNLSAIFSAILAEFISKSANANSEAKQNGIFEAVSSLASNQTNVEISQKDKSKEASAKIENELAEFPNLAQVFSVKQGKIPTIVDVNVSLLNSIRFDGEVENDGKTSAQFTSNVEGRANVHRLDFIPKPEQRFLSKDIVDVVKAGVNVDLEKVENSAFDLVSGQWIFARDFKGHPLISPESINQNKKQAEKPLDKITATSDGRDDSAQAIEGKVLFDGSETLIVRARSESKVKNDKSNFKTKDGNTISNDESQRREESQVVKFDELIHKANEKIGNVKDNLSSYNGKMELVSRSGKFEAFDDAVDSRVMMKEGVKIQDIVDVVKNSILTKENSKDVEIVLRLEPKELGEVVVKISRGEKGFNILFEVKNVEVKQAIESSVNNLKLMLEASNVNLEKVGVMFSDLDLNPEGSRRDYGWRKFSRRKENDLNEPAKFYGGSLIEAII